MKGSRGRSFLACCYLTAFVLGSAIGTCNRKNVQKRILQKQILHGWGIEFLPMISEDHLLKDYRVFWKNVHSLLECVDECLRYHACLSINYIQNVNFPICDVNYESDRTYLVFNKNSIYYEVDRLLLKEAFLRQDDKGCDVFDPDYHEETNAADAGIYSSQLGFLSSSTKQRPHCVGIKRKTQTHVYTLSHFSLSPRNLEK